VKEGEEGEAEGRRRARRERERGRRRQTVRAARKGRRLLLVFFTSLEMLSRPF